MDTSASQHSSYLISIYVERTEQTSVWHGVLITAAGQRLHFSTLAQLNQWLTELAGWQEPRLEPPQDGETPPST
jgi:hypothetical protein